MFFSKVSLRYILQEFYRFKHGRTPMYYNIRRYYRYKRKFKF